MNPRVVRKTMVGGGALVALIVFAALALPMGEVITLETLQANGHTTETQLWIVEHQGREYLRGGKNARWVKRLLAHPEIRIRRSPHLDGDVGAPAFLPYRALEETDPLLRSAVHDAMAAKYGFTDRLISALSKREDSVILALEALPDADR